ncbi:recombination protein NinB [Azotobacter chroococcum]|uniref:NinB protein n=1 Tax=Azotobacter chroococcum TaxID=353 RepID=A0A4R1PFJ5_9GAMM|nr:recombination protein NinB [Azotobacter chroococcum]TBV95290.1 NinB family protein [Azotobacter chroococcum]TCL22081.1 NinB protein [Azotobacter chroococcum]
MSSPTFPLRTEMDRQRAIQILQRVDLEAGMVWSLREEARSDAQNRRMWSMLRDISRQVDWYGQKLSDEDWKHIFSASVQKQRAVPGLDGGFVVLGVSTRKQSKKWFSDMFEVMEAFAAERGARFTTADRWGIAA